MDVYRFAWAVVTGVVVAGSVAYDAATGGLLRMVTLGGLIALFSATFTFVFTEERADRWSWVRRLAIWTGGATVAATSLTAMWGASGAVGGLLLVLGSPALMTGARTLYVSWSARRTTGPLESLSVQDLRRRWEWTTVLLRWDATPPNRRLALVEERGRLLDELQSRDPAHFDDWLADAVTSRDPRHRSRSHPPTGRRGDRGQVGPHPGRPRGRGARPWMHGW